MLNKEVVNEKKDYLYNNANKINIKPTTNVIITPVLVQNRTFFLRSI